jgi:hypothetical protein
VELVLSSKIKTNPLFFGLIINECFFVCNKWIPSSESQIMGVRE